MKTLLSSILFLAPIALLAQTPPETRICEATDLIVFTPFNEETPPVRKGTINGWQAGIGEWSIEDGVLCGDELPEDNHHSSCTYTTEATDLVITAQFRLGGAEQIAFGCRDTIAPNNHLGRTFISRDGIWIQKMSGISKTTKSEMLAELKKPIDPEAWYDITIEICGDHYRAQVGKYRIEAEHERFADAKGIIALISKGQGAQFKNVALWHAEPKGAR